MKKLLQFFLSVFLFLLPWQTIYITREVFLNGAKLQYVTLGFFATEILLWICILLFAFSYIKQIREFKPKITFTLSSDRIFIASLLLFVLYCFASIIWSTDRQVTLQQSEHILEAFLLFFILFLAQIDRIQAAKCFIAGAVLQSILGIYQFLTQSTFSFKWLGLVAHPVQELGTSVVIGEGGWRVLRAYGAFSHPNVFGGFLVISIILTVFILLREKKNNFLKLALFLQLTALFFTFSRAAWIVTVLFFVGNFFFQHKFFILIRSERCGWISISKKTYIFIFVFVSLLTALYWPLINTRISHNSRLEILSTQERVIGYKEAIQIWKTSPWLGVGAGNYTLASYKLNPNQAGYAYQPVHNVPLLFLSEFGIIGFILFFGIGVTFYRVGIQASVKKYQTLFFIGIFLLFSLFDHYLYSSYLGLLFFAIYFSSLFQFSLNKE